jgi:hypothetical protein
MQQKKNVVEIYLVTVYNREDPLSMLIVFNRVIAVLLFFSFFLFKIISSHWGESFFTFFFKGIQ